MTQVARIDDHVERIQALLASQFRRPRIESLVGILGRQVQDLEDALWDLFTLRSLGTAEGVQLDLLGESLGELRLGRTDSLYRVFIGVRIVRNLAQGEADRILQVLQALTGSSDYSLSELFPAKIRLSYDGNPSPLSSNEFVTQMKSVIAAGVGLELFFETANPFIFAGVNEPNPGAPDAGGWGTVTDASIGGGWSSFTGGSGD